MTDAQRPDTRPRFAARVDDWVHRRRQKRAIAKGKSPGVIPYISYGSTEWVRVIGRVLYLTPESAVRPKRAGRRSRWKRRPAVERVRGWRSFVSLHVPYQPVQVAIDGAPVAEVRADRGGVIDAIVRAPLAPGWHTITLHTNGSEPANARVTIVDPNARFGLISDVDDTILNTALPKPLVAAWNSFVLDEQARTSTPGMPVLYDHFVTNHPGAPVIYLSTGAWNVAPTLTRFLERNLYPKGPLLLTDWGPTHDRWFRSGREHKQRELTRLVADFPNIRWILFGDDGQHDEELYHEFSIAHPQNVAAVAIRQLSAGQAVLAGGRSKATLHRSVSGVPWVYGPDGATLRDELDRLGVL